MSHVDVRRQPTVLKVLNWKTVSTVKSLPGAALSVPDVSGESGASGRDALTQAVRRQKIKVDADRPQVSMWRTWVRSTDDAERRTSCSRSEVDRDKTAAVSETSLRSMACELAPRGFWFVFVETAKLGRNKNTVLEGGGAYLKQEMSLSVRKCARKKVLRAEFLRLFYTQKFNKIQPLEKWQK